VIWKKPLQVMASVFVLLDQDKSHLQSGAEGANLKAQGDKMRSRKILVMVASVFLLAISARADKVTADYDHAANFSKYHTFMWVREPEPKNGLMKERIMAAVNAQLTARGLREVDDSADLAIGADVATAEEHTWQTYNDGDGWGWGWGGGWAWTTEYTTVVGTLTVDLFDTQTRKLVWQGVGTDEVSSKPEKQTKHTSKLVTKMFREFPPVNAG
jgi:hypothetical protein